LYVEGSSPPLILSLSEDALLDTRTPLLTNLAQLIGRATIMAEPAWARGQRSNQELNSLP
jgi:hypothetical protein